ncbi:MAG TPA: hypothetical protein VKG78_03515 [Opitutaceae bacterium]|nr:hypothetical protein [Opitutaceae bacterium]
MPTEPGNTVEIDFPWPLEDWAGRGFTPDPEKFAGDFVIEATRGSPRIFVTPVAAEAHRVLHAVLAQPGGLARGIPIEFIPAPAGLAWRKIVLGATMPAGEPRPAVFLSAGPPRTNLRDPSPESEIGLLRTLRMMLNTTEAGARDAAAANPSLSLASFDRPPRSFGDFTIRIRFALRDSTTDTLGVCASVENQTSRRLLFDPGSWVLRAGDRVYPVRTVDFANELEPWSSATAFLVLARGPGGEATRLLPDNEFQVSVVATGSVNPRPVVRVPLGRYSGP